MNEPNYLEDIIELAMSKKPGIYNINIFHDDLCRIFDNGICNCNPKIKQQKESKCTNSKKNSN